MTPAERAQAKQVLLVLSDLPHGWSSTLNTSGSVTNSITDVAQTARCLGIAPSSIQANPPEIQSPSFGGGSNKVFADNSILVFRSATFAHSFYAAFTNPNALRCFSAANQPSTGATVLTPHLAFARLSSPKGTVALTLSTGVSGQANLRAVFTFFVHGQYCDATSLFEYDSNYALDPLAQHLLGIERSRF